MSEKLSSPFIEKSIPCPVCKTDAPHRIFRTRMFIPEEKESDQHVIRYKWLAEKAKPVHPPFYFFYHCPHCYFTDLKDDYANPKENPFFQRLQKAFQNAEKKDKLIVEFVSRHLNDAELDFASALNLHFLAVFIQMLLPTDTRDCYKIGRLLLRAAWLYREHAPDTDGKFKIPEVDDLLKALGAMETAMQNARESWDKLSSALRLRMAKLDPELKDKGKENPYREVHDGVGKRFEGFFSDLYRLKALCKRDLEGALIEGGAEEEEAFFTFPSREAYFEKLKTIWPYAPADEPEAMRGAVSYFERSISSDPRFDDPQKHFSAITLVTDLKVRCGDMDGALTMVRSVYKSASDSRQRHLKEMNNKDLSDRDKRLLKGKVERANYAIEQVRDLRRKLLERMMERDLPKIETIVAEREGAGAEEIEKALEAGGILPELILRMKEKDGLLEKAGKKKRRFF